VGIVAGTVAVIPPIVAVVEMPPLVAFVIVALVKLVPVKFVLVSTVPDKSAPDKSVYGPTK